MLAIIVDIQKSRVIVLTAFDLQPYSRTYSRLVVFASVIRVYSFSDPGGTEG